MDNVTTNTPENNDNSVTNNHQESPILVESITDINDSGNENQKDSGKSPLLPNILPNKATWSAFITSAKIFPSKIKGFLTKTADRGWNLFATNSKTVTGIATAGAVLGAFAGTGFYVIPFSPAVLGWLGISLGSSLAIGLLAVATGLTAYFVAQQGMHLLKSLKNLVQGRKITRSTIRLGIALATAAIAAGLLHFFFPQLLAIAGSTLGAAIIVGLLAATSIALATFLTKHIIRFVAFWRGNNTNPEKWTLTAAETNRLLNSYVENGADSKKLLGSSFAELVKRLADTAVGGVTYQAAGDDLARQKSVSEEHTFLEAVTRQIKGGNAWVLSSVLPTLLSGDSKFTNEEQKSEKSLFLSNVESSNAPVTTCS